MDRRDYPQAVRRNAGNSLQRALALIIRSYEGCAPAELYREAIACFDTLIAISNDTDTAKEFAVREGMDLKYLVDGANFVISKLHFNHENNYYIILGLPESASQEEIRERWKRLMLLYHPDLQTGGEEWVTERAKKVNEAYAELKDPLKRQAYDLKLRERQMSKSAFSVGPSVWATKAPIPASVGNRRQRKSAFWTKARENLPRAVIVLYILGASIVLAFVYYHRDGSSLESELQPTAENVSQQAKAPASVNSPSTAKKTAVRDSSHGDSRLAKGMSYADSKPGKHTRSARSSNALPTDSEKDSAPAGYAAAGGKKGSIGQHLPSARSSDRGIPEMKKVAPATDVATASGPSEKDAGSQYHPGGGTDSSAQKASAHETVQGKPTANNPQPKYAAITKQEVEDFIKRYSAAYEKGNLDAFMTFFSTSAKENDMGYDAIRTSYMKTFRERIRSHYVEQKDIGLEGPTAFVSGSYIVERFDSAQNRWILHRGSVYWKLARENGSLKIVSAHYGY